MHAKSERCIRWQCAVILGAGIWLSCSQAGAQVWYMTGRVQMEDGTPPPKSVGIERVCDGGRTVFEARTDRQGRYVMRYVSPRGYGPAAGLQLGFGTFTEDLVGLTNCALRASLAGYKSDKIDLRERKSTDDPNLPVLTLRRRNAGADFDAEMGAGVSSEARRSWNRAIKALDAKNWAEAERLARAAVQADPRFAHGWRLLGTVYENEAKAPEAREAYQRAIQCDPNALGPYVLLARLNVNTKQWEGARKASEALVKLDTQRRYLEAYVWDALARYNLHDLDGAEKSAREAIRLDQARKLPRAEYLLGLILAAKRDYTGAAEHLRSYLGLEPNAADADAVRTRIASLGKPGTADYLPEPDIVKFMSWGAGETWVPGGLKTLAAAAHIEKPVSFENFFVEYCQALVRRGWTDSPMLINAYVKALLDYFAAITELAQAAERDGDRTRVTLSLTTGPQHERTERILPLLGWRTAGAGKSKVVELGDSQLDGTRQRIPALLGMDELNMQETLQAGKSMTLEIPSQTVRLIGGDAWTSILRAPQAYPGGLAEVFARDPRMPKVYAGLSAMGTDATSAVVKAVGLRTLVEQHSDLLWDHWRAFQLKDRAVIVPGGPEAVAVWSGLVGASPLDAPGFFRALLRKGQGRLAQFFVTVAECDNAHQRLFVRTPATAARYYALLRDRIWQARWFEAVPLTADGKVRFPGGRLAWTTSSEADEEVLSTVESMEALVGLARLERSRKAALDAGTVKVLTRHFREWGSLFPYFEQLPGLGRAEFEALEGFAAAVEGYAPARRNLVLGEWHTLVELMVLASQAGTLDAAAGTRMFRRACTDLPAQETSAKALAVLRLMAGPGRDLDEAVPAALLGLTGERRAAFERVKEWQGIPKLEAMMRDPDDAQVLAALSGLVYAAWLEPDGLLVSEDPLLVRKHRFADSQPETGPGGLFQIARLRLSSQAPGSYFQGGFAGFGEQARGLARGGGSMTPAEVTAGGAVVNTPRVREAAAHLDGAVFRADARLVEVFATVTNSRGEYVDHLPQGRFLLLDEGQPQAIKSFEPNSSSLSCALLLDVTSSMDRALPALKRAALRLIEELRDGDSVAVYSFSETIHELQTFTTDKRAVMRAVMKPYPHGRTALYDALTQVSRAIAGRSGKKVIVVFTDGEDNLSSLEAESAARRAKVAGAPVYAIALGLAQRYHGLPKRLQGLSTATGGLPFSILKPAEIGAVFESVSNDLKHGYLLAYRPPPATGRDWRSIKVQLTDAKGLRVRAREGYYPQ